MSAPDLIHASTVAFGGRAVLILGPSGSGKSALALQLMALGALLLADDQTLLQAQADHLVATCPPTIRGRIEARFVGILRADPAPPTRVLLVIDLGKIESDRLPPPRRIDLCGVSVPLLHNVESGHFPAAIVQYLKDGPDQEGAADAA